MKAEELKEGSFISEQPQSTVHIAQEKQASKLKTHVPTHLGIFTILLDKFCLDAKTVAYLFIVQNYYLFIKLPSPAEPPVVDCMNALTLFQCKVRKISSHYLC